MRFMYIAILVHLEPHSMITTMAVAMTNAIRMAAVAKIVFVVVVVFTVAVVRDFGRCIRHHQILSVADLGVGFGFCCVDWSNRCENELKMLGLLGNLWTVVRNTVKVKEIYCCSRRREASETAVFLGRLRYFSFKLPFY